METCLPSKPLKSQTTVSPQITRFLKNSNSQRCGFDRRVQPRVGMHIFCNIFATFLQNTHFSPCSQQVTRYLKNFNCQTCGFDRQMQPRVGMQIFCKIFAHFLQKTHFLPCTKLVTRYFKNSNSQTCGFDRQMQPRVAMQIFCKIFAHFLQKTHFWPCTKQVTRYFKKLNFHMCSFVRQMQPKCNKCLSKPHVWVFEFFKYLVTSFLQGQNGFFGKNVRKFRKKFAWPPWVAFVYQNLMSESWNFLNIS